MTNGAVWNTTTGVIEGFVTCPESLVSSQCGPGQSFYVECPRDATHIINGHPVTLPIPPV